MSNLEPSPIARFRAIRTQSRLGGALLIPMGLVMMYFFMWRPLAEARAGNAFTYSMKGVLLGPAVVYGGLAVLVLDLRDGQLYAVRDDGKKRLTRKGWIFVIGLIVVLGLTIAGWNLYLKSLGYSGF